MNIGIISSGVETLSLFRFLSRYDNKYLVYCDQIWFPYWEKSLDYVLERIQKAWEFLSEKWADVIIIDPIYELAIKNSNKQLKFEVLPLFQKYLNDFVFKRSLVGKLWILSDFWSISEVQKFFESEERKYQPTDEQKSIRKFVYPFNYRLKTASSWVMNILDLWVHNPFLIRTMKNDLRYFKDANVDTLIPMHYNYFRMQRTIKSFFNFRKTKFHDFAVIENCFKDLTEKNKSEWGYSVSVWINQNSIFLTRNKQLMRQMQRWNSNKVTIEEI